MEIRSLTGECPLRIYHNDKFVGRIHSVLKGYQFFPKRNICGETVYTDLDILIKELKKRFK